MLSKKGFRMLFFDILHPATYILSEEIFHNYSKNDVILIFDLPGHPLITYRKFLVRVCSHFSLICSQKTQFLEKLLNKNTKMTTNAPVSLD